MMKLLCKMDNKYFITDNFKYYIKTELCNTDVLDNCYFRNNNIVLRKGKLLSLFDTVNYYKGTLKNLPKNVKYIPCIDKYFDFACFNMDFTNNLVQQVLLDIDNVEYIKTSKSPAFWNILTETVIPADCLSSGLKTLLVVIDFCRHFDDEILLISPNDCGFNVLVWLFKLVKGKPIILYKDFSSLNSDKFSEVII